MKVTDKLKALQIKANLIADDKVGLMDIHTEVHDGLAMLTGEVESEEQKQAAEELAYEVDGVSELRNEIRVVPPSPERLASREGYEAHLGYGLAEGNIGDTAFSLSGAYDAPGPGIPTSEQFPGEYTDEEVEEEVYDKLAHQHEVEVADLEIASVNQIVYLKGAVKTYDDLVRLQDMVLNTRGVMGVSSEVVVREGEVGTPT